MWALYVPAPLEEHLGRLRYGVLYGLSALGGSVLVYLLAHQRGHRGASGAIFGPFGATSSRPDGCTSTCGGSSRHRHQPGMTFTIPGISWQGHIGGLVTGAAVAAAFVWRAAGQSQPGPGQRERRLAWSCSSR